MIKNIGVTKMRLSITQINMFKRCPASWNFKYIDNLQEKKTFSAIRGQAIHNAIAHFYRAIIKQESISIDDVINLLQNNLSTGISENNIEVDDEVQTAIQQSQTLVTEYLSNPEAITVVEYPITFTVDDIEITGYIDMITEDSCIIDLKTVNRASSEISQEYISQLAVYALATGINTCRIDYFIFRKTPAIEKKLVTITDSNIRYIQNTIRYVSDAIKKNIKYPNREHPYCSQTLCSYWDACHEYYG